jgi:carboxylesterase type B
VLAYTLFPRNILGRAPCLNLLQRSNDLRLRVPALAHRLSPFLRPNRIPIWTDSRGQVMIGYNSDEGATFSHDRTPREYIDGVRRRYDSFADRLLKAYPVGETNVPKSARDLSRDAAFGWHTWIWARLQSRLGTRKVYYYYFDQHPQAPADSPRPDLGAPHGREVPYVFDHLNGLDHLIWQSTAR